MSLHQYWPVNRPAHAFFFKTKFTHSLINRLLLSNERANLEGGFFLLDIFGKLYIMKTEYSSLFMKKEKIESYHRSDRRWGVGLFIVSVCRL